MLDSGEQPLEPEPIEDAGPIIDGIAQTVYSVTVRARDGSESEVRVSEDVFRKVQAASRAGCKMLTVTNRRARRRARVLSRG